MKRIGVDVGGTFTDLYFSDDENRTAVVEKVPSTPHDPSEAVVNGLEKLSEKAGVPLSEIDQLVHGTTVATNTALTHTGAEVGMITTEGFRDILHIARHKKPHNFSLQQDLPWQTHPLVKRRHRLTVRERVTAPHGEVLVELDEGEVRERVRELKAAGVEAIAVCLLHSYLNDSHERRIGEIVHEEFPEAYLSLSSEVVPLYREYERFSTTALNAYVGPKVSRYLRRLQEAATGLGYKREILLMQSSGGMVPIAEAAKLPVTLMMSGPVGGLIGGVWAGKQSGFDNVITLDIGGTSADIGVAHQGELRMRHLLDTKIGDYQAWSPWSTSTPSARAAARSPTWTREASSGSARSLPEPCPVPSAMAAAAPNPPRPTPRCCSAACGPIGSWPARTWTWTSRRPGGRCRVWPMSWT